MRAFAAGAVLLLAVLSGCSAREAAPAEVEPFSSGSASADSTASANGASPPTAGTEGSSPPAAVEVVPIPSLAKQADAVGATAFARYYIATLSAALSAGDPSGVMALSSPDCGGCNNLIEAIDRARSAGQRVRGGELAVDFAEAPAVTAGETIVDLRYRRADGTVVDAAGVVVAPVQAEGPIDTQMRVGFANSAWTVLGFRQLPS